MTNLNLLLGALTFGALLLASAAAFWRGGRQVASAPAGVLLAVALFAWASWLLRGAGQGVAWHAALVAGPAIFAALIWRRTPAARALGIALAATMLCLAAASLFLYPRHVRASAEAAAAGRPYCLDPGRGLVKPVTTLADLNFLTAAKSMSEDFDWRTLSREPGHARSLVHPFVLFVRTGEPQLRRDSRSDFRIPPNLYDVAIYEWASVTLGFASVAPSIVPQQIACTPRADFLRTLEDDGFAEFSSAWGNYRVPLALLVPELRTNDHGMDLDIDLSELAPEIEAGTVVHVNLRDSYVSGPDLFSTTEETERRGFAPNEVGLFEVRDPSQPDERWMIDLAPVAGEPEMQAMLTEIECDPRRKDDAVWCWQDHATRGVSPTLDQHVAVWYPIEFLPHWREIQAGAQALFDSFRVPGILPPEAIIIRRRDESYFQIDEFGWAIGLDAP